MQLYCIFDDLEKTYRFWQLINRKLEMNVIIITNIYRSNVCQVSKLKLQLKNFILEERIIDHNTFQISSHVTE